MFRKERGFTLIELLLVLFFFAVLLASSVVVVSSLRGESELTNTAQGILSVMRTAQNRTVASEGETQYGVYFDTTSSPHQYVLFEGQSPAFDYATRLVSEDEVYKLPSTLEFSSISLGAGSEVVFQRIQGTASVAGNVDLRVKADTSKTKSVYVQSSGNMEIGVSVAASDTDRTKDSRHIHVTYGSAARAIGAGETLRLGFGSTTEDLLISDYLVGSVFDWSGDVVVDVETQSMRIHTHQFNSGVSNETIFSIHRDRRFNTKAVVIELNDSPTDPDVGTIIEYDATGVVTPGTSIYASTPSQQ